MDMPTRDLVVGMVGSGGDGVITMGDMITQAAAREGLHVVKVEAYGPQIRGGESACTVRLSSGRIQTEGDLLSVLVAFNWDDFRRFKTEMVAAPDAAVLYEASASNGIDAADVGTTDRSRWISVPFSQLAKESTGGTLAKNIVALGVVSELFGLPQEPLRRAVKTKFAAKKAEVLASNLRGFEAGVTFAKSINLDVSDKRITYEPREPRLVISGNEAAAIGALHAGCRFFAGYPITPSSEILHFLSEWMPRLGGSVIQTEDELAAIGAVIGASFAGKKAMTATSGPGLALMTEMLGLASQAEVPAVIFDVQRVGPSTGIPTKSEQSDLFQALWGSHGDAPRVVIAPADVEDCFHATVAAFNIAERFQIPVIVLSDQYIAQRRVSLPMFRTDHSLQGRLVPGPDQLQGYKRYLDTPSGVSPMSFPGIEGGEYQTNGLEHDEYGRPTSMHLIHEQMNHKRYRKLLRVREHYSYFRHFGSEDAEVGILCWGSTKVAVEEAVLRANARGEKVAAFVPQVLYPFPKHEFETFLRHVKEFVVVELSYSAQFYKYLRTFFDLPERRTYVHKRSGAKNLTVHEIEETINGVLKTASQRHRVLV